GVGVIIIREGLLLLGRRIGAHGAGTWALPGGHLEFGETIADCARREAKEETGLLVESVAPAPYTNDIMASEGRHYVTLFVQATVGAGDPSVLEPEKRAGWQWFKWRTLPAPLFQPLATLVASGYVPANAA